jgi:dihydroflavonol-4-reductase
LYATNVEGTANLLQTALELGVAKVVYTSSVATVGMPADGTPGDETMWLSPDDAIGHYKRSKIVAEQRALAFCRYGLPLVVVNPTAPLGPWDIKPTPTGKIVVDFLRRRLPAYLDTGLNFIDVRDVARGHLLAAQYGRIGERYILGCQNLTLCNILHLLAQVSDLPAPRVRLPYGVALAAGYVNEWVSRCTGKPPFVPLTGVRMARHPMYCTAQKAIRELGLPQSPIAEALQQAVQWFRAHGYA